MIHINFLGLHTIARDESDITIALTELMQCFIIASDKFGRGFEVKILEAIGEQTNSGLS